MSFALVIQLHAYSTWINFSPSRGLIHDWIIQLQTSWRFFWSSILHTSAISGSIYLVSNICCLYRWCGTLRGCRARCRCCSCWGSPGRMTARCCAVSPTARPATPPWWPGHSWTSSVSGILSIYVLFWYKICTCWKRFSFLQCSSTNIPCGVDVFLSSSSSFVKIIESWCKVLLSSEPGQRSQREHYSHFCFAFVWPGVGIELERNLYNFFNQSRWRSLIGPSPGWKQLLSLSHLRHYIGNKTRRKSKVLRLSRVLFTINIMSR